MFLSDASQPEVDVLHSRVVVLPKFYSIRVQTLNNTNLVTSRHPGGGVLPYMGYIGRCRCEGYGFQAVYSRIGYIDQNIWV